MKENLIPTQVRDLVWVNEERSAFSCVVTLEGGVSFPAKVDRTDKLEHIQHVWKEAISGTYGRIGAYVPPKEPTPQEKREMMDPLSRRQLRLVLLKNGITTQMVDQSIAAMPEGMDKEMALIEWQDASTFYRTNPTLIMVAQTLGISPTDVDAMWLAAKSL